MAKLVLQNICKKMGGNQIVSDLSLDVKDGEFVTLLGPSGSGKTTLLRMIAGLESIDSGDLVIGEKHCNDIPAQKRKLAMVFQSYALFPHMSVFQNIRFGLMVNKTLPNVIEQKVIWAIDMLGLQGLQKRYPKELSGGQRQRVALARALVLDPMVMLLDEPLSNLDAALRELAMEELKRIHHKVGKTIIYVTHNQVEAMTMSQRIAILNAGKLEQYDTPKTVYDVPRTLFAASFIGSPSMNFLDGAIHVENDEAGVSTALGFIKLEKERAGVAKDMVGRQVKVGIRPQNISFVEHHVAKRNSDTTVHVGVELIENMGDRSLVISRGNDGAPLRFLITRDITIDLKQKVPVFIDGRRLHLFDPQTSMNIFAV